MIKFKNVSSNYEKEISLRLGKEYSELDLKSHDIEVEFCLKLNHNKKNPEWHRGALIAVTIDNCYNSFFCANGLVKGTITNKFGDEINFKKENESLNSLLMSVGITNDKKLELALENADKEQNNEISISFEDSNWFEIVCHDSKDESWESSDCDSVVYSIDDFSLRYALSLIPKFEFLFSK